MLHIDTTMLVAPNTVLNYLSLYLPENMVVRDRMSVIS